jgi:GNAT superfamily N-acetyltransferase
MNIERYEHLPNAQDVYSLEVDLSPEDKRVLYLASLTEAARKGMALSEDDTFDWLDKLAGDTVAVSRDDETDEILGMIAYNESPERVWVSYLAVTPMERGGGVGRALIDHVKKQAADRRIIGEATPTSETYYEKLGYDVDENRKVII